MLAVPLSEVYAAAAKFDLRVDFYHWTDPGITARQIKFYQEQFPGNALIHQPYPAFRKEAYDATLMIPFGKLLIALWDLVLTVFFSADPPTDDVLRLSFQISGPELTMGR